VSTDQAGPILVVESDRDIGHAIVEQLLADEFSVGLARSAEHARILARASPPKLLVLGELESPCTGLELLREIRQGARLGGHWEGALPVIVLAGRTRELDVLRAFEAGADDFLSRSAPYLELRARLRAVLRRASEAQEGERTIEVGPLAIDTGRRSVTIDGREVRLRRMEFELLAHLARDPELVCAKADLLRTVWGYSFGGSTRTVDSHASRLRRKLAADGTQRWVVSVRGVGYRLI
jgi:DNA-binding response OmpR family regulator